MPDSQLDRIESLLQSIAYKLGVDTESFNPQEYLQYDNTKNLLIEHLECKGYTAYVNPDKYGIDLIATKNMRNFYFEVEVKNWSFTDKFFPFDTVHFVKRKKKYDVHFYYVIINKERTHALMAESTVIFRPENIVSKQVKRNGLVNDEEFYSLSKSKVKYFVLARKDQSVKQ